MFDRWHRSWLVRYLRRNTGDLLVGRAAATEGRGGWATAEEPEGRPGGGRLRRAVVGWHVRWVLAEVDGHGGNRAVGVPGGRRRDCRSSTRRAWWWLSTRSAEARSSRLAGSTPRRNMTTRLLGAPRCRSATSAVRHS